MVSHSQPVTPVFSTVLPRSANSPQKLASASTQPQSRATSHQPPSATLRNGPTTTELSQEGINAVHNFLIQNGADYKTICKIFPSQTRAMEIAWVITGTRNESQQQQPHPAFVQNLKSKCWKDLRTSLKSLMFDSVRFLIFLLGPGPTALFIGLRSQSVHRKHDAHSPPR